MKKSGNNLSANNISTDQMSMKWLNKDQEKTEEECKSVLSINIKDMNKEFSYYTILRRVLYPFALTGAPITYYLKDAHKAFKYLSRHGMIQIYSILIVGMIHTICGFWLCRVGYHIFQLGELSHQLWDEIFTFLYSLSGVSALDLIWFYRQTLRTLINDLDKMPELDQTILMHYNYFKIKYKVKLTFLTIFVLSLTVLCISYIAIVIVVAINTHSDTIWTNKIFTLCWIMKFKFQHLNLYIETLIKRKVIPELKQLEIIKLWYRSNLSAVKKIDEIFNIFIFGYFVLLFFGIVTEIQEVMSLFSHDEKNILKIVITLAFVILMVFSMFYTLKQTSDVNDDSAQTKSLLYQYVLSTDPEERTAVYFQQLQLMIAGLLAHTANLTLLGLVNLNSDFMAKAVVFLYTYTLLFKQFTTESKNSNKNMTIF
ncbi:unnamed protein product [Medioppia subpectinata]|uniref:Uncharacterized protein n=1 Tax=Medioppia subpectinata TaxID=1979941 RepID=A0A7R9L8M4_9ACAR|nr:unnamed protein product [Medioppia subpectinata]CAG2116247.1 unnamed protein product [Medioppia subpectinata]